MKLLEKYKEIIRITNQNYSELKKMQQENYIHIKNNIKEGMEVRLQTVGLENNIYTVDKIDELNCTLRDTENKKLIVSICNIYIPNLQFENAEGCESEEELKHSL